MYSILLTKNEKEGANENFLIILKKRREADIKGSIYSIKDIDIFVWQ